MNDFDVIIVGAGLSGLRTGILLKEKGYSVLVLEANNRVGGRTTGVEWNNYCWDLGGQWVGPTQDRMYKLLENLEMKTFPQNLEGSKGFMYKDGSVKHYSGLIPPLSIHGLLEFQFILWDIEATQKSFPLNRDIDLWDHPKAKEWDSITVETWSESFWTSTTKNLIKQAVRALLTVEPRDISYLFLLHFIRGAASTETYGDIMTLLEVKNGAQQDRIKGGSYTVSQKLAEKLGNEVKLNEPVDLIKQDEFGVKVQTITGKIFNSKYVVLACAPNMTGRIRYDPPLPSARDELSQRFPIGRVIKCIAFYQEPFWKKKRIFRRSS